MCEETHAGRIIYPEGPMGCLNARVTTSPQGVPLFYSLSSLAPWVWFWATAGTVLAYLVGSSAGSVVLWLGYL